MKVKIGSENFAVYYTFIREKAVNLHSRHAVCCTLSAVYISATRENANL